MKREPDIRPWNEKHKERRKVEGHPCNTVPAEMHTQMIDDRDKKIAELNKERMELRLSCPYCGGDLKEYKSQPAREGWKWDWSWLPLIVFVLGIGIEILIACHLYSTPAAPKGTGDAWRQKCQIVWLELGCHDGDQRKICKVLSE